MTASTPHGASDTRHIGTPQHYRWLEGIVKVTLVLNLLDAIFTLIWVRLGLASERLVGEHREDRLERRSARSYQEPARGHGRA